MRTKTPLYQGLTIVTISLMAVTGILSMIREPLLETAIIHCGALILLVNAEREDWYGTVSRILLTVSSILSMAGLFIMFGLLGQFIFRYYSLSILLNNLSIITLVLYTGAVWYDRYDRFEPFSFQNN